MNEKVKVSWHITRDFPTTPSAAIPNEWFILKSLLKFSVPCSMNLDNNDLLLINLQLRQSGECIKNSQW